VAIRNMIPQTGTGRILFFLHLALILAQWLLPLAAISSLPDQVPVHFDMSGNPDRYASKNSWEMWFGGYVGTFLGVLVLGLLKIPGSYNMPRKAEIALLPLRQRERLHDLMREMLLALFCTVQALVLTMVALIFAFAGATTFKFPWILIVAFILLPMLVLLLYVWRVSRAVDRAKREVG
jgi:uncharacterized membrane protein